jgi:hypothetical protein
VVLATEASVTKAPSVQRLNSDRPDFLFLDNDSLTLHNPFISRIKEEVIMRLPYLSGLLGFLVCACLSSGGEQPAPAQAGQDVIAVSGGAEILSIYLERHRNSYAVPGSQKQKAEMTVELWFPTRSLIAEQKIAMVYARFNELYLVRLTELAEVRDDTGKALPVAWGREMQALGMSLYQEIRVTGELKALKGAVPTIPGGTGGIFQAWGENRKIRYGPRIKLHLEVPARQASMIRSIKGKAEVALAETRVLKFDDLAKLADKQLEDPTLNDVPIRPKVGLEGKSTVVTLEASGRHQRLLDWVVLKDGQPMEPDGVGIGGRFGPEGPVDRTVTRTMKSYPKPLPEGCALQLTLAVPTDVKVFEFDFKDIELP